MTWKTISSKEIFKHPRLTLIEDEVLLLNGHKTNYLKFKDDGSCDVTIIAERDGKFLLQEEYSYPSNQRLFQFPGGLILADENQEIGANRKLVEESGYEGENLKLLGSYLMNHRRSVMKMHVYLATDLIEQKLKLSVEEGIETLWFSENEISKMIKEGKIVNNHALAAWCLFQNRD